MSEHRKPSDEELKNRLTPEQYRVTQCSATEPPFTGKYWDCHEDGTYVCVVCGAKLFGSDVKFDSGTGWPSFMDAVPGAVSRKEDRTHGMLRVEINCAECGAHLGHVFPDGPGATGLRYCVNSASLDLKKG